MNGTFVTCIQRAQTAWHRNYHREGTSYSAVRTTSSGICAASYTRRPDKVSSAPSRYAPAALDIPAVWRRPDPLPFTALLRTVRGCRHGLLAPHSFSLVFFCF